jgi:hypothetical protein
MSTLLNTTYKYHFIPEVFEIHFIPLGWNHATERQKLNWCIQFVKDHGAFNENYVGKRTCCRIYTKVIYTRMYEYDYEDQCFIDVCVNNDEIFRVQF